MNVSGLNLAPIKRQNVSELIKINQRFFFHPHDFIFSFIASYLHITFIINSFLFQYYFLISFMNSGFKILFLFNPLQFFEPSETCFCVRNEETLTFTFFPSMAG